MDNPANSQTDITIVIICSSSHELENTLTWVPSSLDNSLKANHLIVLNGISLTDEALIHKFNFFHIERRKDKVHVLKEILPMIRTEWLFLIDGDTRPVSPPLTLPDGFTNYDVFHIPVIPYTTFTFLGICQQSYYSINHLMNYIHECIFGQPLYVSARAIIWRKSIFENVFRIFYERGHTYGDDDITYFIARQHNPNLKGKTTWTMWMLTTPYPRLSSWLKAEHRHKSTFANYPASKKAFYVSALAFSLAILFIIFTQLPSWSLILFLAVLLPMYVFTCKYLMNMPLSIGNLLLGGATLPLSIIIHIGMGFFALVRPYPSHTNHEKKER